MLHLVKRLGECWLAVLSLFIVKRCLQVVGVVLFRKTYNKIYFCIACTVTCKYTKYYFQKYLLLPISILRIINCLTQHF